VQWIRHRYHRLSADRLRQNRVGTPAAFLRIEYDTGGMTALGTNGVRIKKIAEARGIDVPEPSAP
jgi:hypothetical protein